TTTIASRKREMRKTPAQSARPIPPPTTEANATMRVLTSRMPACAQAVAATDHMVAQILSSALATLLTLVAVVDPDDAIAVVNAFAMPSWNRPTTHWLKAVR